MTEIKKYLSKEDFLKTFRIRAYSKKDNIQETVRKIINSVRVEGDKAIQEYTLKFDGVDRKSLSISLEEIKSAETVSGDLITIMKKSAKNIERFHIKEMKSLKSWMIKSDTGRIGQKLNPLKRVGIYIPGGTALYPSTILMNVIPAKIAGVEQIALVSPPSKDTGMINPLISAAASLLGVKEVYAAGGAQAVAALAFGTETIASVDKITGPGNAWVAEAKRQVFGKTGIDSVAGPSEIAVIADDKASPSLIAADILSQAEHDVNAKVFLITTDMNILNFVEKEIVRQLEYLPRKKIAEISIKQNGFFIKVESIKQSVEIANFIAPEHIELQVSDYKKYINMLNTSGAVFCGKYSCESVGDYWAGPNHTLPTDSSASFSSALSVRDFVRWTSIIECSRRKLRKIYPLIARFARAENLEAHARAVEYRFKKESL